MAVISYNQDSAELLDEDGDPIGKIYREGDGVGSLIEERINGWCTLSEERDILKSQVATLRETLADARTELEAQATYFGPHLDPENNLFRILQKVEATLEATKEGA